MAAGFKITVDNGQVYQGSDETASSLTAATSTKPGGGSRKPVYTHDEKPLRVVTGTIDFDSSYPTGGEPLTEIFNMFVEVKRIAVDNPLLSAGTGKACVVDYTNKKLKLVTNAATPAEVANASDQSGAAGLRFTAYGW